MFIDTPEGYDNLTEKSREILQLLNLQEMEHFDWFLKADDDTYVIMENMRFILKGLNPERPAYLGYQLEPTCVDSPYMSDGAGYVFSLSGLKRLVEKGFQVRYQYCYRSRPDFSKYQEYRALARKKEASRI
ncbi:glycoprotein-N-acetylgalactosamine 3-beta-galactosyltransferase 1-like [Dreissena polymorpha]|uniref:glycoprotein-N-acetylgalactosamine 3-beta-galactosyltransferase 1-like n=1 Tax=Dreissena polymorpha TaxID=45954 RepID=UPI0022648DD3|nr:glycoprotein-N-acetylgalactosamine 3-beta-galactosyltransferase 1-like [Dreissena polymorpha]